MNERRVSPTAGGKKGRDMNGNAAADGPIAGIDVAKGQDSPSFRTSAMPVLLDPGSIFRSRGCGP